MMIRIDCPQAIQEVGQRTNQEDTIYPDKGRATAESRYFMVCDGMGGHAHGEVASRAVVDAVSDYLSVHWKGDVFTDDLLREALNAAYDRLDAMDDGNYGLRKMGTTFTFLCLHRDGCSMAHIGDSRIYHIRPSERKVLYKSRDHSLAYDLFLAGELTEAEMEHYEGKNILTRAMQPALERRFKADIAHAADIQPGDYFCLCSDGMLERMGDAELIDILRMDTTDEEKRQVLEERTAGNKDNHSAYLVHVVAVEERVPEKPRWWSKWLRVC